MMKLIKNSNLTALIAVVILIVVSLGCHPRNLPGFKQMAEKQDKLATEWAKELVKKDPEYKKVDSICQEIPLPNDFNLIVMKAVDKPAEGISYFYTSSVDFDTAEKDFRKYFSDNQWKPLDHSSINRIDKFKKEDYVISIQYGNVGNADYSIHCGRWSSHDHY